MQLWPEVMREPEIPVLHGQQEPHTQQLISAPQVAQPGQHGAVIHY